VTDLDILYVEDNAGDRELTRRHLARHAPHLRLAEAPTLRDAIEHLTTQKVDLVLSDYRLPDGTGLDLLEAVKARRIEVPVVLVTGSGDADAAVRLLKAGAADYIAKRPGYLDTLPAILEGAYRWFAATSEIRRTPVHILYAEHDPEDAELARRAFKEHGGHLRLEVATRAWDALQCLRTAPYDLLLLDYRLPDLTGIEVLKALRAERIRVPVVMVAVEGDEDTAVEAFKLGAGDYLVKREGYLAKLPSTVEQVLAQRRLADEKDALFVLNGIARSLTMLRDPSELVHVVARAAAELLKTEIGMLWLGDGSDLVPVGWAGLDGPVAQRARLHPAAGDSDRAAAVRRLDIGALLAASGLPADHPLQRAGCRLAVSLVTGGPVAGVLAAATGQPREFGPLEERLLAILADHAAIAIENARLYQQLKDRLQELHQTQAQLLQTEKIAAMGQLLAGVAHELNNPLSVILGYAALLRAEAESETVADRSGKIAQAADRCARIVRNFLALARQHPPECQETDLNQVVREAVELLEYSLRVDAVEVVLELASLLPPIWADPNGLHQILVNLATNAHHAMRGAPAPRRLTIATRRDPSGRHVHLDVVDTGPGIPPEIRARIFEPFFTTKPRGQGTGLGLSLCRGLVESHGGTLDVDSERGQGARFRVTLPLSPMLAAPPSAAGAAAIARGKAILVVDDDPEVADVLTELLKVDGHAVEAVGNGTVALERLQERLYDAILCDVRMPGLDGPALYRELGRRRPDLCRRLIFITGDELNQETIRFLEETGAHNLAKPFDQAGIRRVIARTLGAS
jgi:signal transduction histidine kinase